MYSLTQHLPASPARRAVVLAVSLLAVGFTSLLLLSPSTQVIAVDRLYPQAPCPNSNYVPIVDGGNSSSPGARQPRVNSTLGFQKILYLNLPERYDLDDAMILQAAVADIDVTKYDALIAAELNAKGLPPQSSPYRSAGGRACYRSHANMWRKMLEDDIETMLIMESDAAWDRDIRGQLAHFAQGMHGLLTQMGRLSDPQAEKPTPEDPYMSKHWEVIQFGGCWEKKEDLGKDYRRYHDPYMQQLEFPNFFDGEPYGADTRVLRAQNEVMCTTAYAVTRSAARKLLLRAALDMNTPIDGLIAEVIRDRHVKAFTVSPYLIAQWEYRGDLGVLAKNSDIDAYKGQDVSSDTARAGWRAARKEMNVWAYNGMYRHAIFRNSALHRLKRHLYGENADL